MSPDAQRVAIAEACGWKRLPAGPFLRSKPWRNPVHAGKKGAGACAEPPDYLNNLNAIVEACRKTITDADYGMFEHQMLEVLERDNQEDQCRYYFGRAAQYSEAFLKTLLLWDDSK